MKEPFLYYFTIIIFALLCHNDHNSLIAQHICPSLNISVAEGEELKFSTLELSLVCEGHGGDDWTHIPMVQKKNFLTKFLAERGYYYPTFEEKKGILEVSLGKMAVVERIELAEDILNIDPNRLWKIYGKPINSATLDDLERWILSQYANKGYPCVKLNTKAYPRKNLVSIMVQNIRKKKFGRVLDQAGPVIRSARRRFDAFDEGDLFRQKRLLLTQNRLKQKEHILDATLTPICTPSDKVNISQHATETKPRLVSIGVGFDSDDLLFIEGSWSHSQLFDTESYLKTKFFLASNRQLLSSELDWYYAPVKTRHHLRSSTTVEHRKNKIFESKGVTANTGPVLDFDKLNHRFSLWIGPSFEHSQLIIGEGPKVSNSLLFRTHAQVSSENFELYRDSPNSGYAVILDISHAQIGLGSLYTGSNYHLLIKSFHNILNLDPALWVLGLRAGLIGFSYNEQNVEKIPINAFPRIGGASTLRGLPFESIPEVGIKNAIYSGLEIRINNIVPFGLAPFTFLDFARVRETKLGISQEKYISPGLGVNWNSPIGTLRLYFSYPAISRNNGDVENLGFKLGLNIGEDF